MAHVFPSYARMDAISGAGIEHGGFTHTPLYGVQYWAYPPTLRYAMSGTWRSSMDTVRRCAAMRWGLGTMWCAVLRKGWGLPGDVFEGCEWRV
eukprot:2125629-Rhodomonas_salina.2